MTEKQLVQHFWAPEPPADRVPTSVASAFSATGMFASKRKHRGDRPVHDSRCLVQVFKWNRAIVENVDADVVYFGFGLHILQLIPFRSLGRHAMST